MSGEFEEGVSANFYAKIFRVLPEAVKFERSSWGMSEWMSERGKLHAVRRLRNVALAEWALFRKEAGA